MINGGFLKYEDDWWGVGTLKFSLKNTHNFWIFITSCDTGNIQFQSNLTVSKKFEGKK